MKRTSSSQGVALVITLAMIAMMTFLVVAFLSRSLTNFQSENASTGNSRADLLARSACQIVVSDFKSEIIAGSTTSGTGSQARVYTPKNAAVSVPTVSRYTALPTYDATFNNLVKQSTGAFYDATNATYNFNTSVKPMIQAVTDVTTADLSANGRSVVKERWDNPSANAPSGPLLLLGDITYGRFYTNTFLPHWVMLSRQGVPTSQSGATIPSGWKDYSPGNADAAIGRFAYNIYNVGGLLDANAAGYDESSTSATLNLALGQKGTQGLAKISLLPGMGATTSEQEANAVKFAKTWRNAASGGSVNDYLAYLGFLRSDANNPATSLVGNQFFMAGPKTGFLKTAASSSASDNRILGRQDLIRLAVKKNPTTSTTPAYGLTYKTLAYMTHFSREVNAPSWTPTTNAPVAAYNYLASKDDASSANRFFPNVRVGASANWRRLTGESAVEGEPLIKYRFPLAWLALLQDDKPATTAWDLTPEATKIVNLLDDRNKANGGLGLNGTTVNEKAADLVKRAFGLTWDVTNYRWTYVGSSNLANTSAISIPVLGDYSTSQPTTVPPTPTPVCRDNREPNFFELLKAGILRGSLGSSSDYESMCVSAGEDANPDYQVMQIGANIIDQADTDSYPTQIAFGVRYDNPAAIQARKTVDAAGNPVAGNPTVAWPFPNDPKVFSGVEDLPYIQTFLSTPYRIPAGKNMLNQDLPGPDLAQPALKVQNTKQDMLDCWLQFVMWKPYQPPVTAPATTMKLRIVLNGGYLYLQYFKDAVTFHGVDFNSPSAGKTEPALASSTVNFDDSADFRAPTLLGGMGATNLHNFTVTQPNAPTQGSGTTGGASPVPLPRGMWMGEMFRPEKDPSDADYKNAPGVSHTEFRANYDIRVELQFQDAGGNWRTYQRYDRVAMGTGSSNYGLRSLYGYADDIGTLKTMIGGGDWSSPPYYRRLDVSTLAISAIDPRSHRYGLLAHYRDYGPSNLTPSMLPNLTWNNYLKQGWAPKSVTPYSMCFGPSSSSPARFFPDWAGGSSVNPWASHTGDRPIQDPTYFWVDNTTTSNSTQVVPTAAPQYYLDMDGVQRNGDGDSVASPGNGVRPIQLKNTTPATANTQDLGRILNRPFRSVGELGYVFRDEPYKSLNLFTDKSADGALLDLFSVNEQPAITGGRVNLNTKSPEVIQALIVAAAREEQSTTNTITAAEALTIANAMYANTKDPSGAANTGPIMNPSEIANRLAKILPVSSSDPNTTIKARREVVGRALADAGQTRTWNLLVDVIAQSGRFGPNATKPAQFIVEGERRYWLHVAIDRYTGQVVDQQLEPVME